MTSTDVAAAVRNANALLPSGELINPRFDAIVYTNAIPRRVRDIGDAIVKLRDGKPVRIADVASVVDAASPQTQSVSINGNDAVYLNDHRAGAVERGVGHRHFQPFLSDVRTAFDKEAFRCSPKGTLVEHLSISFVQPHAILAALMRNRFDHLAKQIGKEALGPSGTTVAHDEISPETLHADLRHEPDPARKAERARLGLLGRIASVVCLIEIYGHAPNAEEFRACLAKHIAAWQQRTRKARADHKNGSATRWRREAFAEPFLWIITAGAPTAILTKLKLEPAPGWPAGVYFFGDDVFRVGVVVASMLPRERSTLLVRLMAAGPLLAQAIEELVALPPNAHERAVAEQILLDLQHVLGQQPRRTPEEQEFIVVMHKSWEDTRAEARAEGRAEARAADVLTALRVRGIAVSMAARKRILAQKDLQLLERWHERAIVATSLGEVIGDRAEDRSSKPRRPAAHKERSGRRSARAPAQR